jgi:hypothetical protein
MMAQSDAGPALANAAPIVAPHPQSCPKCQHRLQSLLVSRAVPAIYAPQIAVPNLGIVPRFFAFAVTVGCATVLFIASWLTPDPRGVGSHTELGMPRCEFHYRTGVPCPSCGMTTSFAHFARGNLIASFYVQPMGFLLAVATSAAFWVSLYMGITGKPVLLLLRIIPPGYYLLPLMFFAIAAWGWKIFIHWRGIDGWG